MNKFIFILTSLCLLTSISQAITKKKFDFVVGQDGNFKAALSAASVAASDSNRFYIFFPALATGYDIGSLIGNDGQTTNISTSNLSIIGENMDDVILYNTPKIGGLGKNSTIWVTQKVKNIYMQDITLLNKGDFRTGKFLSQYAALQDFGDKSIFKNVKLLSNQDTYFTTSMTYPRKRAYWESGEIHGTVDFICGAGDIFFNNCLIYLEQRSGNVISAPCTTTDNKWGFVFFNCTIDGFSTCNNNYRLGRAWRRVPKCVYINTTMKLLPKAEGWGDPMSAPPVVFAEYNSRDAAGNLVDLSKRRSYYFGDSDDGLDTFSTTINPILTELQAANYTIENVLGGTDSWNPQNYTKQATAPVITLDKKTLRWENSSDVLCWEICKDGSYLKFDTINSFEIPSAGIYTVRAANEMGGLSASSNSITIGEPSTITWPAPESITYGTPLSATQLNASVSGTTGAATYNQPLGTILPVGKHTLTVTFAADSNYWSATASVDIVVLNANAIENYSNIDIKVYPNPVEGNLLHVLLPACEKGACFEILSLNGEIILSRNLDKTSSDISIETLPIGTYFFKVDNGNKTETIKFIKK